MLPPVRRVRWSPWRVIPDKFGGKRILSKLDGDVAELEPVESLTGAGSDLILRAFLLGEKSRFSAGRHGVYYAARSRATAIAETRHHREEFLRSTGHPPILLQMQTVVARLEGELHDIRGLKSKRPALYSKTSYFAGQELAEELVKEGSNGIVYDSVRHEGGQCAAVFRPDALSNCRKAERLIYEWDGTRIIRVGEVRDITD